MVVHFTSECDVEVSHIMLKRDNEFQIKTYGTCTNGYGPFFEENVTCIYMNKNMFMYCLMTVTSDQK